MVMKVVVKGRKFILYRLGIFDGMKDKISKVGLDMNIFSGLYNVGGLRVLLIILVLFLSKMRKKDFRVKLRVIKKLIVFISVVKFFVIR